MNDDTTAAKASKPLAQRLENLRENMKARRANNVVQFPLWPESARGTPNSILRSALFAAIDGSKKRKAMEHELIASQKGIQIYYTGLQLDQSDLDVFEQALHIARQHPLGNRCEFSGHSFLKSLGKSTGKSNHEALKRSFSRLLGCGVEITQDHFEYGSSLLEYYRDKQTDRYVVIFNPKLIALYDAGYTEVDWQQRRALRKKPLALWLHGYLASHAKPYSIRIETVMKLSGSHAKEVRYFKKNLLKALDDLVDVGMLNGYEIRDTLIIFDKIPSATQQRYLDHQL